MGTRAGEEQGFGLIELLIALTLLSVGILALFGAFNAGSLAIRRASNVSTAAALADQQMEGFRAMSFASIGLVAPVPSTGGYILDTESASSQVLVASCAGTTANQCMPTRPFVGPDGHTYQLNTYVVADGALKRVTVTVRDGAALTARPFARESSSFGAGF